MERLRITAEKKVMEKLLKMKEAHAIRRTLGLG
jgi:hypothetical protein